MCVLHSDSDGFIRWIDRQWIDYFIQCGDSWPQCLVMDDFCLYMFAMHTEYIVSVGTGQSFWWDRTTLVGRLQHDGTKRG